MQKSEKLEKICQALESGMWDENWNPEYWCGCVVGLCEKLFPDHFEYVYHEFDEDTIMSKDRTYIGDEAVAVFLDVEWEVAWKLICPVSRYPEETPADRAAFIRQNWDIIMRSTNHEVSSS